MAVRGSIDPSQSCNKNGKGQDGEEGVAGYVNNLEKHEKSIFKWLFLLIYNEVLIAAGLGHRSCLVTIAGKKIGKRY